MKRAKNRSGPRWLALKKRFHKFMTPFGLVTSLSRLAGCDHEWERDGQTLTATRWTCSKCHKTLLG